MWHVQPVCKVQGQGGPGWLRPAPLRAFPGAPAELEQNGGSPLLHPLLGSLLFCASRPGRPSTLSLTPAPRTSRPPFSVLRSCLCPGSHELPQPRGELHPTVAKTLEQELAAEERRQRFRPCAPASWAPPARGTSKCSTTLADYISRATPRPLSLGVFQEDLWVGERETTFPTSLPVPVASSRGLDVRTTFPTRLCALRQYLSGGFVGWTTFPTSLRALEVLEHRTTSPTSLCALSPLSFRGICHGSACLPPQRPLSVCRTTFPTRLCVLCQHLREALFCFFVDLPPGFWTFVKVFHEPAQKECA